MDKESINKYLTDERVSDWLETRDDLHNAEDDLENQLEHYKEAVIYATIEEILTPINDNIESALLKSVADDLMDYIIETMLVDGLPKRKEDKKLWTMIKSKIKRT